MYLKSIEVHGFKAFANKIVFDFHNGITGIVGPNGSGKSNVADAVRWVLGEQSAKQLRGASMQDVIFAGTENRKPLSYAYVAITLDNSDHQLPIEFEEVTVARRVYRSGESEYLLNGSPCRLKDVNELFYDTGIGKEGYSIIGQGQIERILSGRPEERRELFDEAAGIVKYKRRKVTAQKKLEHERENLVRVNDILAELERQLGPLERQSEKAHQYLKKKDELKTYDVNMFLLEVERIEQQLEEAGKNYKIASEHLTETKEQHEKMKSEYEKMETAMTGMDEKINQIKDSIAGTDVMKGKLEGQINVLREQIRTAEMTEEHLKERLDSINIQKEERKEQNASYEKQREDCEAQIAVIEKTRAQAEEKLHTIQAEITRCKEGIESGKNEIIELLNQKASVKARQQRYDTMLEQVNIRKAQLNQRLLQRKTEESGLEENLKKSEEELAAIISQIEEGKKQEAEMLTQKEDWRKKTQENTKELEQANICYNKTQSKLESLKNIAERYEGYGNSIRRIMDKKEDNPKIHGVVADLIQVEKEYETAIETALSGNIQNVVTEDEETAKEMIQYLKENRYGRATFLPITSVGKKEVRKNEDAQKEKGVLGYANELVKHDKKYTGIMAYLLGRVLVVDTIDHAIAIARKYHYSLHMVTLEGEYFSPGGSMSGGAFKNNSNLLGRKRELEELEKTIDTLKKEIEQLKQRGMDIRTAKDLLNEDLEQLKEDLQKAYILKNTAEINVRRAKEQKDESESVFSGLKAESIQIENQILEINQNKEKIIQEIEQAATREAEIEQANKEFQEILDEQIYMEESAAKNVSEIQLEEANIRQKTEFVLENLERIHGEVERLDNELVKIKEDALLSKEDAAKKRSDIEEIEKTILASDDTYASLVKELKESQEAKEQMNTEYRGFFEKREEVSRQMNELDKEIFRLNQQREKLEEALESQQNYMWEEYELTFNNAKSLRNEEYNNLQEMKKSIAQIKEDIRRLGDVNVNAIEEYKEVSERYGFLKGQHDDLIEAEQTLMGIIEDLDIGMKKQFAEKFAEIQREFDKAFKELFGGGRGTLELVEEEDILESGIRIIAQPPGKKLQNMMQLSGGEKSLTAIALLFAIQNLKPSPFCLLDEIEAALDDNNVTRFAKYLHKLTKNTQFIIITHRRGTMAAADRLYGITMQEKGVSTLVSVDLIEKDLD
ncbi:MAG: chromosome segregation protein SMC [Lachnospiraceae bacterium]